MKVWGAFRDQFHKVKGSPCSCRSYPKNGDGRCNLDYFKITLIKFHQAYLQVERSQLPIIDWAFLFVHIWYLILLILCSIMPSLPLV